MKQIAIIAVIAIAAIGVLVFVSRSRPDADAIDGSPGIHRAAGSSEPGSAGSETAANGGGLSKQGLANRLPKKGSQQDGSVGSAEGERAGGGAAVVGSGQAKGLAAARAAGKVAAGAGGSADTSLLASGSRTGDHPQNIPDRQVSAQQQALQEGTGDAAPEVAYASDAGKSFPVNTQTDIPLKDKMSGDAGAVSLWLQPQWQGKGDDATFVQFGDTSLQLAKNIDFLRFEYVDPDGIERGLGMNIDDWKTGEWHQVTGTWDGNQYTMYVDGKVVSQNVFPAAPNFEGDTHLMIGSNLPNGAIAAPGNIDQVTVLNRSMSPDEIAQQFNDGAATHH